MPRSLPEILADTLRRLEAVGASQHLLEEVAEAVVLLDGCKRAWRETANGKEWYKLVPIPAPEETP